MLGCFNSVTESRLSGNWKCGDAAKIAINSQWNKNGVRRFRMSDKGKRPISLLREIIVLSVVISKVQELRVPKLISIPRNSFYSFVGLRCKMYMYRAVFSEGPGIEGQWRDKGKNKLKSHNIMKSKTNLFLFWPTVPQNCIFNNAMNDWRPNERSYKSERPIMITWRVKCLKLKK